MLSEKSLDWFYKSKREMQLFQRYFIARAEIERKLQSQWTLFSIKWRDKFEDLLKEGSTPPTLADRTRCKIMTLLLDEPVDICRSESEGKGQSRPSEIIKRWLVDPITNTSCLQVDHFQSTFYDTIDDLDISEATVYGAKRSIQEVFEEYHIARVDEADMERVNGKKDREERLRMAKEVYQKAVRDHKEMEKHFTKEMAHLTTCLESFENNRLSVLKNALDVHQTAMDKSDKERESRKQRNAEIWGYLNGTSVEQKVKTWLGSMKKPFHASNFQDDPFREDEVVDATPARQTADGMEVTDSEVKKCPEVKESNDKDSASTEKSLTAEEVPGGKSCYEDTTCKFQERMVVALQSYTNRVPGHLSFKKGQKIQQLKAANSEGLGYGGVVIDKHTRHKIYGYFPVSVVKAEGRKRKFKYFFKKNK